VGSYHPDDNLSASGGSLEEKLRLAGWLAGISLSALSWSSQSEQAYPRKMMAECQRNRQQASDCSAGWKRPLHSLPTHSLFETRTESVQLRIMHPAKEMSLGFRLPQNQLESALVTGTERICWGACCFYLGPSLALSLQRSH
jgi:hypothetical protein